MLKVCDLKRLDTVILICLDKQKCKDIFYLDVYIPEDVEPNVYSDLVNHCIK